MWIPAVVTSESIYAHATRSEDTTIYIIYQNVHLVTYPGRGNMRETRTRTVPSAPTVPSVHRGQTVKEIKNAFQRNQLQKYLVCFKEITFVYR